MTPRDTSEEAPGEGLRRALAARGWTQADLAGVLNLSRSYVSELVNGGRGITPLVALRLEAAGLGSAVAWAALQRDADLNAGRAGAATELEQIRRRAAGA